MVPETAVLFAGFSHPVSRSAKQRVIGPKMNLLSTRGRKLPTSARQRKVSLLPGVASSRYVVFTEGACYCAEITLNVGAPPETNWKYEKVPVPSVDWAGFSGRRLCAALQH